MARLHLKMDRKRKLLVPYRTSNNIKRTYGKRSVRLGEMVCSPKKKKIEGKDTLVFRMSNQFPSIRNYDVNMHSKIYIKNRFKANKIIFNRKLTGCPQLNQNSEPVQTKTRLERYSWAMDRKSEIKKHSDRQSHWKTFTNQKDIDTRNYHGKRNKFLTSNNPIMSNRENPNKNPQLPGVSISGFDRIVHPRYSKFGKFLWICSYLLCMILCLYFIKGCVIEYVWGEPAISVELIQKPEMPCPSITLCPSEIFGKNVFTTSLREKFCNVNPNNTSCNDINNIDLLDIFDPSIVTQEDVWDVYKFTPERMKIRFKCSTTPNDKSCMDDFNVEVLQTASGNCLLLKFQSEMLSFGPVSGFDLVADFRNVYNRVFLPVDFHTKVIVHNYYDDVTYFPLDFGMVTPLFVKGNAGFHPTKIKLLNTSISPCFDGKTVENCISKCLNEQIYKEITCRLPFMKTNDLPVCLYKEEFSSALKVIERVLANRFKCSKICPPLCENVVFSAFLDVEKVIADPVWNVTGKYYNEKVRTIQQYHWYTFFNLLADVGGNLGFFLDLNLLSLLEILHLIFFITRTNIFLNFDKSKRSPILEDTSSKTNADFEPSISIAGFDRILNPKVPIKLKIFWIICIFISASVCSYQIESKIVDYLYGEPATRVSVEVNETVKFPTITLCPYRPFEDYPGAIRLKDQYLYDFNVSEESYKLSDLLLLEDLNVTDIWDEVRFDKKWIELLDINCKMTTKVAALQSAPSPIPKYVQTILGTCISLTISTELRYHGLGTSFCSIINPGADFEGNSFAFMLFAHNDEDDPRTLDLDQSLIFHQQLFHVLALDFIKLEYLSYPEKPCADSVSVSRCRSKCLDDHLTQQIPCRLPFIKNETKSYCTNQDEFNTSMTIAREFYSKKLLDIICKCPRKCQEYLITALNDVSAIGLDIEIPLNILIVYFSNNIFSVIKQYRQLNLLTLFSGICGSLGLFLGICALSVLEIVDYIIFTIAKGIFGSTAQSKQRKYDKKSYVSTYSKRHRY